MSGSDQIARERQEWFATTHWTVVLNARSENAEQASNALTKLCEQYRPPIHSFIRGRGYSPSDADDLTQQFFARFLEKEAYKQANPARGRFRAFLLTMLKNFLVDEWEKASAKKRGGGQTTVPLDEALEMDAPAALTDEQTADRLYDQSWARTLLAQVREKLRGEYSSRPERFAQIEQFLPGEDTGMTYAEAAAQMGVTEGTIKSDVHRLKRRYGELLREAVAGTVGTVDEIEGEWRYLINVLRLS